MIRKQREVKRKQLKREAELAIRSHEKGRWKEACCSAPISIFRSVLRARRISGADPAHETSIMINGDYESRDESRAAIGEEDVVGDTDA